MRKAEDECLKLANNEQIGKALKAAVRPVMRSEFDRITIKNHGVTYSVYLDGDERLHVRREHKVTEDKTE